MGSARDGRAPRESDGKRERGERAARHADHCSPPPHLGRSAVVDLHDHVAGLLRDARDVIDRDRRVARLVDARARLTRSGERIVSRHAP